MRNKMKKLNKNTQYRITQIDGKKEKGYFKGMGSIKNFTVLVFLIRTWAGTLTLIISEKNIKKIETVEKTTVEQQARAEGRMEEYNKYAALYDGDKKRRTKFKYETVFEMNKNQIRS
tara:strand:+ start:1016 stop:1366 length:351 start_codon:yes stop_codon:yes gene_type:complete